MSHLPAHPQLTGPDQLVLANLFSDIDTPNATNDSSTIHALSSLNDPGSPEFEPTVATTWDLPTLQANPYFSKHFLQPYIRFVQAYIVRHPTDVVFATHLGLILCTSLPSALWMFRHFTYLHGILHVVWTFWCMGAYTLLLHNHIHQNGLLNRTIAWLDQAFPYIVSPLMGHTWHSYYYHHVKMHHCEGNGPDDLSSTIRYQRDSILDLCKYVGKFLLVGAFELSLYFVRKNRPRLAFEALFFESANLLSIYLCAKVNLRAAVFVFMIPLGLLRIGLMLGNWGQHALVDELEPESDLRSSITLIDVASNRFCFNDGYHTSHHLNSRRHWREHPVHFISSKATYAKERALVFHNIDYLELTYRLMRHDYAHLARCMVPIGEQIGMSIEEIAVMLRSKTRKFTEEEIKAKFGKGQHAK